MNHNRFLTTAALLTALLAPVAGAQSDSGDMGLFAMGGSLGYVSLDDVGGALAIGLHADIGQLGRSMAVFPEISYWAKSRSVSGGREDEYQVRHQEFGIAANLHYYLNPQADMNAYVGAGVGLFTGKTSIEDPGYGLSSDLEKHSAFGFSLLGGLEKPIGEGTRLLAEGRYKIDGQNNTISLRCGLTMELGS